MRTLLINIFGEPVPKGRPKFRVINSRGRQMAMAYTPKKTRDEEDRVAEIGREHVREAGWVEADKSEPIELEMDIVFGIPKSFSKKKAEAHMGAACVKKPDLDNVAKLYTDALNDCGIWHDDSQITSLIVNKYWGKTGSVQIIVRAGGE